MREELKKMRDMALTHQYHNDVDMDDCFDELTEKYIRSEDPALSDLRRETLFFQELCNRQQTIVHPGERIAFTRTIGKISPGRLGNICADWEMILNEGITGRIHTAENSLEKFADDPEKVEFLSCSIDCLKAGRDLIERHAEAALSCGNKELAVLIAKITYEAPETFHEALLLHNFVRELLWLAGHNHIGFGRFEQYMMPFLRKDLDSGVLTLEEAEDLLTEFFIAANRNTAFYFGVQQGDNGQSLMLGGVKPDGSCAVNELTYMCMRVSDELNLIDPKINLRVDKNTSMELLELAAKLTRRGLGFPQYSNDDVVIPALAAHGYDIEDARDYTVAACWEFIIPGKGLEVPNIDALSFPHAVDTAIRKGLSENEDFEQILEHVKENINHQINRIRENSKNFRFPKAPLYSAFLTDCLEKGLEAEDAAKYKNFGIHGSASANAADALAMVRKFVFEEKTVTPADLLKALEADWEGFEELRDTIIKDEEKVGNNNKNADELLCFLFDSFADACEKLGSVGRGKIVRPGTGSAMFYVFFADKSRHPFAVDATADGRHNGEFFSSSLAPAPHTKSRGPISVLQSYSKIDYSRICNGGPITMELSDSIFKNEDGIEKVAHLIREFVKLGCQQLQLNTLNVETLKKAKKNPELYKNLIVRVWGWSGYFCELETQYQDHIIMRQAHQEAS